MIEDIEDFKAYLLGNFPGDYLRLTSTNATEDVKTAITSRHEKSTAFGAACKKKPGLSLFTATACRPNS